MQYNFLSTLAGVEDLRARLCLRIQVLQVPTIISTLFFPWCLTQHNFLSTQSSGTYHTYSHRYVRLSRIVSGAISRDVVVNSKVLTAVAT